jgi:hypothetical protein
MSTKNSNDAIGIFPATLQFVVQCLDQLRHRATHAVGGLTEKYLVAYLKGDSESV